MKKLTYLLIALLFSACAGTVYVPSDSYIPRPTPPPIRWYNGYYFQYYSPGTHYYTPYHYGPPPRPHHNGPRHNPRPRR